MTSILVNSKSLVVIAMPPSGAFAPMEFYYRELNLIEMRAFHPQKLPLEITTSSVRFRDVAATSLTSAMGAKAGIKFDGLSFIID
ncbi:MAG: hypothetical protein ABJN65_01055 [Parasphingorhabdus sp.]